MTKSPYPPPPAAPQSRAEKKNPPSPPVMFVKLKSPYGIIDWASRPNDLNNLLKSMKELVDVNVTSEGKDLSAISTDPEKNPILYRSGHFHFQFTDAQRSRLREYLLNGGTIIFNTGMGSKPFFDSAIEELKAILPEVPIEQLGSDHPIFHSHYDLGQVEYRQGVRNKGYSSSAPLFYGVTINCRTVAVVSRWGMAIGWDELKDPSLLGYSVDSAKKLGINIMAYATAQRAWAKNAARAMTFVDSNPTTAGKIGLGQIIYGGEWKTRHAALPILLQQFNQRTDVPVTFSLKEFKLTDDELFNTPVIYMTGHESFRLSGTERQNLRNYLLNGGFLLAEACCGRQAFRRAFLKEINNILPEYSLASIPQNSQMFALPNQIETLSITPALSAEINGKQTITPKLLGIDIDGHYAVVCSPYAMAGGWEMSQNPYAFGYNNTDSLALGENILFYALTH